jgi:hypothetical protein
VTEEIKALAEFDATLKTVRLQLQAEKDKGEALSNLEVERLEKVKESLTLQIATGFQRIAALMCLPTNLERTTGLFIRSRWPLFPILPSIHSSAPLLDFIRFSIRYLPRHAVARGSVCELSVVPLCSLSPSSS